jgi:transcriptional regulator with XRE-family HTH domain
MRTPEQDLKRRLKNTEYAKLYGSEDAKTSLAITLSRARRNLKLTQKEFAEKIGKTQPYIAKLESGTANPTIGAVGSMLATVGLSLEIDTKALIPCIPLSQQELNTTTHTNNSAYHLPPNYDRATEEKCLEPTTPTSDSSSSFLKLPTQPLTWAAPLLA